MPKTLTSRTLLVVLAHPDDEAFGTGGTLAHCAANGVNVHLICATKGEAGKVTDPSLGTVDDVGKLREQELKDSCKVLGIHEPIFLGYLDSGRFERTQHGNGRALMNVDEVEIEQKLLGHFAILQPDILLTFDPHGIYGHIDHIKIHRATTAAFWSSGKVMKSPPKRLFYTAMSAARMKTMQQTRANSPLSKLDADLYGVSDDSFAAILHVEPYVAQKQAAIAAHRSQVGPASSFAGLSEGEAKKMWEEFMVKETFTLGGLRGSFPEMPISDLFAGLEVLD
jgi:N-acetyl-1-D-myo-inositol-2-amino-2-deoxy-alpha-D-glucopyranoside deacetylase